MIKSDPPGIAWRLCCVSVLWAQLKIANRQKEKQIVVFLSICMLVNSLGLKIGGSSLFAFKVKLLLNGVAVLTPYKLKNNSGKYIKKLCQLFNGIDI